jgi:hypothetical protein
MMKQIIILILLVCIYVLLFKNYKEKFENHNIEFFLNKEKIFNDKLYISSRNDRYGANSIPWISMIYLSKILKKKLYHNCHDIHCKKYSNNLVHKYLILNSNTTKDINIINNDYNKLSNWSTSVICKKIYSIKNKVFPDVFHNSKESNEIFNLYHNKYKNNIDTNIFNSIIIHIRLDDVAHRTEWDYQEFIGEENLIKLINYLYKKYRKRIYFMMLPNIKDKELIYNILQKSNISKKYKQKQFILGSQDMDYDLYLMMICKQLIISKSTFPFISALVNKNIVYTTDDWIHYRDILGHNSNSDKIKILNYK